MNTLFQCKAKFYEQYRPKFPEALFQFLEERLGLNAKCKSEKLLDLGCGTGQLAIPLSRYFNEVIAVDPSSDMLSEAKIAAEKADCFNICWIESCAEDLPETLGKFELITIANAFHWMDHEMVVPWILRHLQNNGFLVLAGSYKSFWQGGADWQKVLFKIVDEWFGQEKERIMGYVQKYKFPWEDKLSQYSFSSINVHKLAEERTWSIEKLIGLLYSMSFIDRKKVEHQIGKFEQEIKEALLSISPDDRFIENHEISVILAKK